MIFNIAGSLPFLLFTVAKLFYPKTGLRGEGEKAQVQIPKIISWETDVPNYSDSENTL